MSAGIVLVINWCSGIQSSVSCPVSRQVVLRHIKLVGIHEPISRQRMSQQALFFQVPTFTSLKGRLKSGSGRTKIKPFTLHVTLGQSVLLHYRKETGTPAFLSNC